MAQILHIFRKDVRHHWIEIVLCQLALALYCWNEVRGWSDRASYATSALTQAVVLLLPLTWFFFVFRVVQSESLVGDRQFWVTRPYEWKKLLAEKVLLVLAFITFPMLIAGFVLLVEAGFPPTPYIVGVLWMQVLMLQFPLIPLLALASVTRNLVQSFGVLLAIWLVLAGNIVVRFAMIGALSGLTGFSLGLPFGAFRRSSGFEDLALVLICVSATTLQYAKRRTAWSRIWLIGGVVTLVLVGVGSEYAMRNKDPYPVPAQPTASFHVVPDSVKLSPPKFPADKDEDVYIALPMSAWGVPPNSLGWVRGMRIVLEAPDGFRWESHGPESMGLLVPGENHWRPYFRMKYEIYQRLKPVPLKAHVSVVVETFREHDFEVIAATDGEFAVPRVGRCRMWGPFFQSALRCNSPLVTPPMVVVRSDQTLSTCPDRDQVPLAPMAGVPYAWHLRRDSGLAEYGVSPVARSYFHFDHLGGICPGMPLVFSLPEPSETLRSDFEMAIANLDEYRLFDFSGANEIKGADGGRLGLAPLR